ncbi:hypothetical protein AAVH_04189 [Aphelenchoides avenae]|nr:hypothetical protein AAVH_04189 [Aphelenchus avenae]
MPSERSDDFFKAPERNLDLEMSKRPPPGSNANLFDTLLSQFMQGRNMLEPIMSAISQYFGDNHTGNRGKSTSNVVRKRQQYLTNISQPRLFDDPVSSEVSFSVDSGARTVQKDEAVGSDPLRDFMQQDWKNTLFGPSGLLTQVFNLVNEKRKQGLEQAPKPQADLGPAGSDFAKLFEKFLQKTQSGDFDEPLPELPFIGICNRLSCGDIYKAMDEFKKSELFSNFQTALSLMNDPKGWDIIGELLANPELIEQYVNGGDVKEIGRKAGGTPIKSGASNIRPDDGDLGIDFSHLIDEKPTVEEKSEKAERPLPEISESVDYYSSLDKSQHGKKDEESEPDHIDVEEHIETAKKPITTTSNETRALPEISESIDGMPEELETVAVEETIHVPKAGDGKPAASEWKHVTDILHDDVTSIPLDSKLYSSYKHNNPSPNHH